MFRRRLSNKRSAGVVSSCCSTYPRAVSTAFRPYSFCANFILLFFTFFFLFAHNIYDHIISHFLLFVVIGLGAAAAEIIYALSSAHLG
jgi:hypothetical protein